MDELGREAERLLNTIKIYCGSGSTPQVLELETHARRLYDNFRGNYNPRELENQAKIIKESLYHMDAGAMTTNHCLDLKKGYEQLRINLRKFE